MAKGDGKKGGESRGGSGAQKGRGDGRGRGKGRKSGSGSGRGGSQGGSQQGRRSKEERATFQKERKAKIAADLQCLNDKKKEQRLPLEESVTHVKDELSGEIRAVKDLDRSWIGELSFLEYLPMDNSSPQSREALQYLNNDVRELLLAPYHVFWSYVLLDKSFSLFLDSFLRYFDQPELPLPDLQRDDASQMSNEALKGALFQRVFLVLCRMSQMEEEPHLFMSSSFYTDEITKNHLLDLPKLIDLARLYGCHNRQKVVSTLKFLFYQVSRLKRDFKSAVAAIAEELDRASDAAFDESGTTDLQSVLSALVDISYTLATFLDLAPNSALYTVRDNRQLVNILFYVHDAAAARLESSLDAKAFAGQLLKLRRSVQAVIHAVVERCYLGPLLLGRDKRNFSPDDAARDVAELISSSQHTVESFAALKGHPAPTAIGSLLAALEDAHSISTSLRKASAVVPNRHEEVEKALSVVPESVTEAQETRAEIDTSALEVWESKRLPLVKMVKEILGPDYGEGFVDACLVHYNDSVEHVVAHVFDGSLHESLRVLEQGMARPSFTHNVAVAQPTVLPYKLQVAPEVASVVRVHYGKKSSQAKMQQPVPESVKDFARNYQEDLLYDDEWDDSFDGQAPVRIAGDTTSDEVSNLSISGTYDPDGEDVRESAGDEDNGESKAQAGGRFGNKGGSSTRSYAQKRNRKKLAAKKRAV